MAQDTSKPAHGVTSAGADISGDLAQAGNMGSDNNEAGLGGVYTTLADDDLVSAMRDGDADALEELYARYSRAVYALANRMLTDSQATEEVVQDAFYRVWKHAGSFDPGRGRFISWLLFISHNLALEHIRKARSRPVHAVSAHWSEATGGMPEQADPTNLEETVWLRERRTLVMAAMHTLPEVQRQAVELAYYGGLSQREIAAMQEAPLSTVKTRLALGLNKITEQLRSQGALVKEEML